tara:strand:+ start:65 stop:571 length:507 start_codon:yes stop_codon:yes gene_type:complete
MKIEDNFLGQKEFDELQTLMMGNDFPWHYSNVIDFEYEGTEENKFMYYHMFYFSNAPTSPAIEIINPLINKINPKFLGKIKANLLTRTPSIVENEFHVDIGFSEKKMKQLSTSIFYVNTNNGYTKFEDETIVESVANRVVTFPANMKHTGTSCTDEKTRVIINFNYFK